MLRSVSWLLFACTLFVLIAPITAQERPADPKANWKKEDGDDGRWNETDIGPFLSCVLKPESGPIAKGLSLKLGQSQDVAVAYDTQSMTLRTIWQGNFIKFDKYKYGVVVTPRIAGTVLWDDKVGWHGHHVHYRGLLQHGRRTMLSYTVDGCSIMEHPWAVVHNDQAVVIRRFRIGPHKSSLQLTLTDEKITKVTAASATLSRAKVRLVSGSSGSLRLDNDRLQLQLPASNQAREVTLLLDFAGSRANTLRLPEAPTWDELSQPAEQPLWQDTVTTDLIVSNADAPYVVDTLPLPFDNPYRSLLFVTGHDFFSDDRIAVSTLHGDVWIVSGMSGTGSQLTWRRYATGLHQPLGLRIVADKVFVLGRDQITRLHDRNGDGEADFYENFNNDGATSERGHDYAACLETDDAGNFYYIRAHEGVVRVSPDGRRHEAIANGFRNPVGLGVSPSGIVTASPQEGNWTPASAIFEVRAGGYYGFGGPRVTKSRPLGYDPPLCWLPRLVDNSSGGQTWVTSERWGPLHGKMLHFSYGQCAMMLVLGQTNGPQAQAAVIRFPFFFESGVMRGRFSPHDGQLYVSGTRGWQTSAAKDGCLQRVRFTGKPIHMPTDFRVTSNGLRMTFSDPLDSETAADPDNYDVEWWNYRYAEEYGSQDYLVSNPKRFGRDEVYVEDVRLGGDGRTVTIELEELAPVMQMKVSYSIKAADGTPLKHTLHNTIHFVPESK